MGSPKALGTEGIKTEPVGSGPYVMDKAATVKDSQTVFTARKDYWNKDLQKFEKLTFKILTDPTARTNALVSGQVDATLLDPKTGKQAEGAKMKLVANEVDWQGLLLLDRDGTKNPGAGERQGPPGHQLRLRPQDHPGPGPAGPGHPDLAAVRQGQRRLDRGAGELLHATIRPRPSSS